jgi:hypothetical protein
MTDDKLVHCPECGVAVHPTGKEEYWHLGADGEGAAGPFETIEEAKADALEFLHDRRWQTPKVKIVKVVATSYTEVTFKTTWNDGL